MANVLVADDDPVSGLIAARALGQAGYTVSVVHSGLEALDALQRTSYDAIVTDWMMPDLDGIELIRKVRARFDPVPALVMLTCLGSAEARWHALESGADEHVVKPASPRQIVESVARSIARRGEGPITAPVLAMRRTQAPSPAAFPIVVIGANAGGPAALRLLFRGLGASASNAAYVIAQHGQAQFVTSLLAPLREATPMRVEIATAGHALAPGLVLLAPGGQHAMISEDGARIELSADAEEHHVRPSGNRLFRSAARASGPSCIAVVLTGMGGDCLDGAAAVRNAGGMVLVATPGPQVAAAMPERVIRAGLASAIVGVQAMGEAVSHHLAGAAIPELHAVPA